MNDIQFHAAIMGDSLRALYPAKRTPAYMWALLADIEKAELKLEVSAAMKPRV
jgi:hypothetical protein